MLFGINKYLDDRSHLEVPGLQLSAGLELPLILDLVPPADEGPDPGTDPPVDVLGGLAVVGAGGVRVSVPGSAGVTAGDARELPSPGHVHGLGQQGVGGRLHTEGGGEGLGITNGSDDVPDLLQ